MSVGDFSIKIGLIHRKPTFFGCLAAALSSRATLHHGDTERTAIKQHIAPQPIAAQLVSELEKTAIYVEQDDEFRAGTAHNWEVYRKNPKEFSDEGVDSYFWRAHTLTVFFIVISALCYTALQPPVDAIENAKRGIIAVISLFVVFGVTHMPNMPFIAAASDRLAAGVLYKHAVRIGAGVYAVPIAE